MYFPKGYVHVFYNCLGDINPIDRVYVISTPIITLYYTQLIGDAKTPPTLLATASFEGMAVIGSYISCVRLSIDLILLSDADPYIPGGGGAQYYVNQNNLRVLILRPRARPNCPQLPICEELRNRSSAVC